MMVTKDQKIIPWYSSGLKFTCTGCGACCTGSGRVWLNEPEIFKIAELLKMEAADLVEQAIERREGRWTIKESPHNGDCHFLEGNRCTIYQARPQQCQGFPWWPSTLSSQAAWEEARRVCEGIDHEEAKEFSLTEINEQLKVELESRKLWK
ncbi:MAG: zinc/iron-chelating domain-containing protein [Myxococcales bacterium]|nr:zinc/iron-chelating domain-containing protein [Myxococcales bacterium]